MSQEEVIQEHLLLVQLQKVPEKESWVAVLESGFRAIEGRNGWWNDVVNEGIKSLNVMGMLMPFADRYEFKREAFASVGASGSPTAIVVKCFVSDSVCIVVKFVDVKHIQSYIPKMKEKVQKAN